MESYAFTQINREQKRQQVVLRRRAANAGCRVAFQMTASAADAKKKVVAKAPAKAPAKAAKPAAKPAAKGGKGAVAKSELSLGQARAHSVLGKASASAFRGGLAGFAAGVIQVGSFMWMRTAMNYQYVNGGNMIQAISALYKAGGIPRFYQGVTFAIIQNPLSRFGDTAANTGVLAVMDHYFPEVPVTAKTAIASLGGATWRIALTPIDTFKTTLQVQGVAAFGLLKERVAKNGIGQLYSGCAANFTANWVGNFPWFATFNFLQRRIPQAKDSKGKLLRNAAIGVCASAVSDTVSNSLRVIKTVKQTATADMSYVECVKGIVAKDGVKGLFGRGLQTRLITNMLQSMVFSVGWKFIEEELNKRAAAKGKAPAPAKGKAAAPAKAAPKPAPKAAPKKEAPKKEAPKAAAKPAPKAAPKKEAPKPAAKKPELKKAAAPKPAPKAAPKPAPKAAPKPAPKAAPKPAPKAAPKVDAAAAKKAADKKAADAKAAAAKKAAEAKATAAKAKAAADAKAAAAKKAADAKKAAEAKAAAAKKKTASLSLSLQDSAKQLSC